MKSDNDYIVIAPLSAIGTVSDLLSGRHHVGAYTSEHLDYPTICAMAEKGSLATLIHAGASPEAGDKLRVVSLELEPQARVLVARRGDLKRLLEEQ